MSMIDQVQKAYIAYYGRPADPEGLAFWVGQLEDAGGDLTQILNAFGTSDEFNERFGDDDDETLINNIYANLFGREADKEGLEFYLGLLEDGEPLAFIAQRILDGAQNEDADDVDAKLAAAKLFTAEVEASGAPYEGDDAADEAALWLATINSGTVIDADAGTIDGKTIADIVEEVVPTPSPGETFTLTPGTDDITGTDGDDVFNAPLSQVQDGQGLTEFQTLNNTDVLDGGDGFDRLNATLIDGSDAGTGSETTPELIENIEQFFIRSRAQDNELVMTNVTGVEQVWNDKSTQNLIISDLQEEVILGVIGGNGKNYTVTYNANATDADFMQAVVLQGANIATLSVTDLGGNLTGLSLDVTGGDVDLALAGGLLAIEDLMISGDSDVDLTPALTDLETIESTTTGDVTVTAGNFLETASFGDGDDTLFTGGAAVESISMGGGDDELIIQGTALNNDAEIDMGDGDDRLALGANISAAFEGMLDGGAGTNTLAMTSAKAAELSADDDFADHFTNFQKLEIGMVLANETDTVDLSNLNDISYVISGGVQQGTAAGAQAEIVEIEFTGLLTGQSVTVGGIPYTNTTGQDQTADDVATAVLPLVGAINDGVGGVYSATRDGATITFEASTTGDTAAPITVSVGNSTVTDLVAANTTDGSAPVPAATQVTTVTFADIPVGQTLIIDGVTITATGGPASALDIAEAFVTGTTTGNAVVAGSPIDYSADPGAWSFAFGDQPNEVDFTFRTADTPATLTVTGTAANTTTTTVKTAGNAGDPGVTETADVTFTDLESGQSVVVAGRVVTAINGELTASEVAEAFFGGVNADFADGSAVISGTLTAWTADDPVGAATITFTSTTPTANVTDIDAGPYGVTGAPAPDVPGVEIVQEGTLFGPAGQLVLDDMASDGTLELTGLIEVGGSITVNVTGAALAASNDDVLNLILNGNQQLLNVGVLNVADVETINITTTNSSNTSNPTGSSRLQLDAPDTETLTVAGNHGVDFTGPETDLSSLTLLDASGVQAEESTAGADDAGFVGRVWFAADTTNEDMTVLTGNGNDIIDLSDLLTSASAIANKGAVVSTGDGDDWVIGSAGADVIDLGDGNDLVESSGGADTITLGDGNDTYELVSMTDSTIASRDVITDFNPNTVAESGANKSAAADVADRDGDVIDLSSFGIALVDLQVEVFNSAADADTFLANQEAIGTIALDASTGFLYMDLSGDGNANSVIELAGVTTIDEAAFVI